MYQTVRCFVQRYMNIMNIFHMYEVVSSLVTLISIYVSRQPLFQQVYDDNMIEYPEEDAENFISTENVSVLFADHDSESVNEEEMTSNAITELISSPDKPEEDDIYDEKDEKIEINNISILRTVEEPSMTKYWDKKYVKSLLAVGGSILLLSSIAIIIFVTLIM